MNLSVREVASLLGVSEHTVHRWIRADGLPAQRVHHQYRVNRVELHEWALAHGRATSPHLLGRPATATSLSSALERGGVHRGVPGSRREQVLAALVELPTIPRGVNRRLLFDLLLSRDVFVVSRVAGGMAMPHPRDPVVLRGQEPHAVLGFLEQPVSYGSTNVGAVLLLFAPSVPIYLGLLAMLGHAVGDQEVQRLLTSPHSAEGLVERIRILERESANS